MAKPTFQPNPQVHKIFDDLDKYRSFCVEYGYRYDESTLYNMADYVFRQHSKQLNNKEPKDNWNDGVRA